MFLQAVSLIVCEGLSVGAAAQRLGIENDRLRNILRRRRQPPAARSRASDQPLMNVTEECHRSTTRGRSVCDP
jgi:predicted HTH domain antitoxin